MFYHFLSKTIKDNLILLNGLGTTTPEPTTEPTPEPTPKPTTCVVGKDCPEDQVCDKLKCVSCKEDLLPDESQLNCIPGMFYLFLF